MDNDKASESKDEEGGASRGQTSPLDVDQQSQEPLSASAHGFVAASPPRLVSFEDLMKASHIVQNMVLSHEIAVNDAFTLQQAAPPANSIEKQVADIMKKAFWDSLQERLAQVPPDYSHALVLIAEVKEKLLGVLLPQQQRLKARIDEVLDLDLIAQKIEHDAFNLEYYIGFIVSTMGSLCAPVRDGDVVGIKECSNVALLFQEIFRVLDLMHLDMANFTISQFKPYIQQQSVEYERQTFTNLLKTQSEAHIDGLEFTRFWLSRSYQRLLSLTVNECLRSPSLTYVPAVAATPAAVLNCAYIELLQWNSEHEFPETCLLDGVRFTDCSRQLQRLALVGATLLAAAASPVGQAVMAAIAGGNSGQERVKLKDELLIIAADFPEPPAAGRGAASSSCAVSLAEHVVSSANQWLRERKWEPLPEAQATAIKEHVTQSAAPCRPVYELLYKRMLDFVFLSLSSAHVTPLQAPAGTSAVATELTSVCGKFLRLVSHNKAVFGQWYTDIVSVIMNANQDISPR